MEKYRKLIRRARKSVEYWTQVSIRDFVRGLDARMDALDMNRAQLAEKIGASPAYVTKVMRGDVNFTLETMNKLAMATGGRVHVQVVGMPNDLKATLIAAGSWRIDQGSAGATIAHVCDFEFSPPGALGAANDQWVSKTVRPTSAWSENERACVT